MWFSNSFESEGLKKVGQNDQDTIVVSTERKLIRPEATPPGIRG